MYERSAIVLERYLEKLFGFNKENNLRDNIDNFNNLIEELKEYQTMVTEEEKVIGKFDDIAKEIQSIQKSQEKLCLSNQKLEDERNKLFNAIDENPNTIQKRLEKIEETVEENNEELKRLREEYIKAFVIFIERQKERNKFARGKRTAEANHVTSVKNANEKFQNIPVQDIQKMKNFITGNKEELKVAIIDIMIKNGKNEKIGFNEEVINRAVEVRIHIAEKEAECYVTLYDKFKKILNDIENDNLKLEKYEKILRDNSVKISFLNAEKEYIVEFLDNERMTVIGGPRIHKQMMQEACENFEVDINQINNLYELILKEISGKSTKKAYKELYNKTYLRDIEEKEKNFEKEVTNIKINIGTVINSNYWRIEGIKNVYEVFQKEVTEKFDKDLSEYKLEEIDILENNQEDLLKREKLTLGAKSIQNNKDDYEENDYDNEDYDEDEEYDDYDEYEEDYEDEEYDDYEEDDYEDEEYDDYEDDYEDEEYDDYEDDYGDYEEDYEDEEYDDYEEDDYEDDDYGDYEEDYEDNDYDETRISSKVSRVNNAYNKNAKKAKNKKKNNNISREREITDMKKEKKTSKKQENKSNSNRDNQGFFNKLFKKGDK